jgi:hypothetical protein
MGGTPMGVSPMGGTPMGGTPMGGSPKMARSASALSRSLGVSVPRVTEGSPRVKVLPRLDTTTNSLDDPHRCGRPCKLVPDVTLTGPVDNAVCLPIAWCLQTECNAYEGAIYPAFAPSMLS